MVNDRVSEILKNIEDLENQKQEIEKKIHYVSTLESGGFEVNTKEIQYYQNKIEKISKELQKLNDKLLSTAKIKSKNTENLVGPSIYANKQNDKDDEDDEDENDKKTYWNSFKKTITDAKKNISKRFSRKTSLFGSKSTRSRRSTRSRKSRKSRK